MGNKMNETRFNRMIRDVQKGLSDEQRIELIKVAQQDEQAIVKPLNNGKQITSVPTHEITDMVSESINGLTQYLYDIFQLDTIVGNYFSDYHAQYTSAIEMYRTHTAVDWINNVKLKQTEADMIVNSLVEAIDKVQKYRVEKLGLDKGYEDFLDSISETHSELKDAFRHAILNNRPTELKKLFDKKTIQKLKAIKIETTEHIAQETRMDRDTVYLAQKGKELAGAGITSDWQQIKAIYQNLIAKEATLSPDEAIALYALRKKKIGDYKTPSEQRSIEQWYNKKKERFGKLKADDEVTTRLLDF